ncbi:MAG: flagellin-like protein [Thiotrichales bacterium]|nr:flagellin-like protein [Thiotrichales bacterium]
MQSINTSLASGSKMNQAADNPAGQAIVSLLTSQVNTQDMAVQNANSGINLLQTATAGAQNITESILRMNELAVQAQNGTLNTQQRNILNLEFQQNLQSINGLANNTSFNGLNLLNGESSSVNISLGDSSNTLDLANLSTDALGLNGLNISDPANAGNALQGLQLASEQLLNSQSQFGAQQNGLQASIENMSNQNLNTLSTRSQISDTDYARAVSEQVRQSILNESSMAMQVQNNQSRDNVLQLLSG